MTYTDSHFIIEIVLVRVVQLWKIDEMKGTIIVDKIYKILPGYAFIPIASRVVLNVIVYFGSRIITSGMYHHDFSIFIDKRLPFVAPMMIIYVLAYVHWIVGFGVIGRESREICYEFMSAEQIAKLMCLLCFIAIPTTMMRPEITGNGFSDWLSKLIYMADNPDNLFPSIHCLESWIVCRGAMKCKKMGNTYKIIMFVGAVLVFASTLLVKQHVFVDIIGGIGVVEIGLLLSKKLNVSRIYYNLENKLEKNER